MSNIYMKKAMPCIIFCFSFIFLSMENSYADTHYVSPSGTAAWAASTNINTPCSVTTAMSNAQSGDLVYFRGGTYNYTGPAGPTGGTYHPVNSGTGDADNQRIIFRSYNGETPEFRCTWTSDAESNKKGRIIGMLYTNYCTWDGFKLSAAAANQSAGFDIRGSGDSNHCIGNKIINCTIIGQSTNPVTTNDNWDLNRIEDTDYTEISNNVIGPYVGNPTNPTPMDSSLIKLYHNTHITIKNNVFKNIPTNYAISGKGYNKYVNVGYNHFYNVGMAFYQMIFGDAPSATPSIHIYHNVMYTVLPDESPIKLNADGDSSDGIANDVQIYNNTIVGSTSTTKGAFTLACSRNIQIYNNICRMRDVTFKTVYDGSTILREDHNQWGTGTFSITTHNYGSNQTTYSSLASWKSSGELINGNPGASDLTSNPKLVNATGIYSAISDFALVADSPCKSAGSDGADMGANLNMVGANPGETTPPITDTTPPSSPTGVNVILVP